MTVHFHSSDDRFCGTDEMGRRFTLEPNDVTCELCMENDRLEITAQGLVTLARTDQP